MSAVNGLISVALGGALGCVCRFLLVHLLARWAGASFPWGTLAVNTVGCGAAGVLLQLTTAGRLSPAARLALASGFLGGFTTYSGHAVEVVALATQRAPWIAALYLSLTIASCLGACVGGLVLARRLGLG